MKDLALCHFAGPLWLHRTIVISDKFYVLSFPNLFPCLLKCRAVKIFFLPPYASTRIRTHVGQSCTSVGRLFRPKYRLHVVCAKFGSKTIASRLVWDKLTHMGPISFQKIWPIKWSLLSIYHSFSFWLKWWFNIWLLPDIEKKTNMAPRLGWEVNEKQEDWE